MSFQRCMLIFLISFSAFMRSHVIGDGLIASLEQKRVRCHDHEKAALLQFKQSFLIDCGASRDFFALSEASRFFHYSKMKSWQEHVVVGGRINGADCCTWDGVECDKKTNYVIGLHLDSSCIYGKFPSNSSIFSLDHLLELHLSNNDFNNSQIPSSVGRFNRLKSLGLSNSHFSGLVPSEISLLSSLNILDLSNNIDTTSIILAGGLAFGKLSLDKLVNNMTRLTKLYLEYVDISSSVIPLVLTNITSLTVISLSDCQLYGDLPPGIFQLPHLEVLHLFDNERVTGRLPEFRSNSPLMILDLQGTGLSGALPSSIGNLGSLEFLSINFDSVPCPIPSSLGNLTNLSELTLSPNGFSGSMPSTLTNLTNIETLVLSGIDVSSVILESWLLKLNKLTCLNLFNMNMGKKIPSTLANLTGLTQLGLESNQLFGTVPQGFANLTQLIDLFLRENQLEGPVQPWLSTLVNLKQLDLSDTKFDCIFEKLFELPSITELSLANINLTFLPNVITNYSSLPKITILDLSSCNVTKFPQILETQNELYDLSLEGNNIVGHLPQWFMDTTKENLLFLNLSSNHIVGFEQPLVFLPWTGLVVLDLKGNKLQGPLPIPSNTTQIYDVSNNHISGAIPDQICLANSLTILDLSNNSMSGRIPSCIGHKLGKSLQLLNLRGNSFRGTIPQRFHKSCTLKMINLSDNQLEGTLPRSLVNCTQLEVLDLGKNRVNDTFPSWLGTLNALQVLVLRHNKFHGEIRDDPKLSQAFGTLRVIDVSHNFHGGSLPSTYLRNWRAMQVTSEDQSSSSTSVIKISYQHSHILFSNFISFNYVITISNKGSETLYQKILTVVRVVDFSSNNFTGEIPSFLGYLGGLQALNLSNNKLEGSIPSSLSKISDLESLDLSQNMLSGVIPQELNKLTFLEVFNVSHNRLVGLIPQGPQFNTFDNSSYDGNFALCGYPVSKKCGIVLPSSELPTGETEDNYSDWIGWVIGALGCASGFIVGYVIGKLYITDKYHVWFIRTFAKTRKTKSRRRNASNQRRNR